MATVVQPFSGTYELDHNHSSFQFAVRHLGVSTFRASFHDFDAQLVADDAVLVVAGYARAESVSIADPDFREHVVRGSDFFEANTHPQIAFRSTSVALGDDGSVTVTGMLTIRGVSQPVTAEGTYVPPTTDPFGLSRAALELRATVDRRDWDMNWQLPLPDGSNALGWDVEISAHLELVKKD